MKVTKLKTGFLLLETIQQADIGYSYANASHIGNSAMREGLKYLMVLVDDVPLLLGWTYPPTSISKLNPHHANHVIQFVPIYTVAMTALPHQRNVPRITFGKMGWHKACALVSHVKGSKRETSFFDISKKSRLDEFVTISDMFINSGHPRSTEALYRLRLDYHSKAKLPIVSYEKLLKFMDSYCEAPESTQKRLVNVLKMFAWQCGVEVPKQGVDGRQYYGSFPMNSFSRVVSQEQSQYLASNFQQEK